MRTTRSNDKFIASADAGGTHTATQIALTFDDNRLASMLFGQYGQNLALIEDVRVATHCRSRGIGEQMVQWAIAEARGKGCKLVELLTHNTRVDAQRFYARLGFQPSHVGMTLRFE